MARATFIENGEGVGTVEAFILGDGRVVSVEVLKQQAIGGTWPPSSRQLEELEKVGFGAQIVEPPFDVSKLYDWIYLSPLHGACVHQKAIDVVERGYQIARAPGLPEDAKPDDAQRERLQAFLDAPNPDDTFTDIMSKWVTDWEAVGNGYLEVIRGPNDQLAIYHMPAPTVRVRRHREGYVQVRGGRRRYFKWYGDEHTVDNRTGREAETGLALEHVASEVLHLKLYTHLSEFYGAPQWLSALSAMLGSQKAHEFNIEFFDNRAVPAYAVLVKGGRLSKESKDYIETFFREQLKGQHHRTVVLEALPGMAGQSVEVTLEPLAVEVRDASFRLFRLDNATEILVAHRVPPYRVGWAIVGSLGGATAAEMTQIYKESAVKPRQTRLEAVLNRLFRDVLQVTDWELRFQEIDVRDEVRDMDLAQRRLTLGAWSPNDVAMHLGKEPVPGGDERIIWINPASPVRVADLPTLVRGNGNGARSEDDRLLESLGLKRFRPATLRARERLVKRFQDTVRRLLAAKAARYLASLEERRLVAAVEAVRAQGFQTGEATAEKAHRPLSPTQRAVLEALLADLPEAFEVDDLLAATVKHMLNVANWSGTSAYAAMGFRVTFDLKNRAIIDTFKRLAGEHIRDITATARQDLQDLLIEKFFDEGLNPLGVARAIRTALADEIEETYKHRAETIARTETGIAQEVTQDEVFRRAGVQTYTWITAGDDKVRESHQRLDGVTVKIGDRFPNGLRFPLDPEGDPSEVINCRCDVLPGFEDVDLSPEDAWAGE